MGGLFENSPRQSNLLIVTVSKLRQRPGDVPRACFASGVRERPSGFICCITGAHTHPGFKTLADEYTVAIGSWAAVKLVEQFKSCVGESPDMWAAARASAKN